MMDDLDTVLAEVVPDDSPALVRVLRGIYYDVTPPVRGRERGLDQGVLVDVEGHAISANYGGALLITGTGSGT